MKKMKFLAVLCLASVLCACDDDKKDNGGGTSSEIVDYKFLDATSYTDWVYFSFEKKEIVNVTDFQNDLSWDIAFHRGDIRLNGGASGKGEGKALNTQKTDWSAVTSAPASGYTDDKVGTVTVAFTGEGTETAEQPFSQVLAAWLTIDTSNPPPVYTYHDYIFIVKDAAGKYVKLTVYDYKNAKNAGAYISFKYQYAKDSGEF